MKTNILVSLLLTLLWIIPVQASTASEPFIYTAVGDVPSATMEEIKSTLQTQYLRINNNFNITKMPPVTIKIWQDRKEFEHAYGENAEWVQGYVKDWEIRFFNGRPKLGLGVVHEYTHLVTIALNPSFDNNPRWLWEATAVYESKRPPVPDITDLKCFSKNASPTLKSLNQHPSNIYKVGYFLTEFIVSNWGQEKLNALVSSNGNIQMTLSLSEQEFEKQWLEFLVNKYNLKLSDSATTDC